MHVNMKLQVDRCKRDRSQRSVLRQPAWTDTYGEWFPVKKDVSTSTPWISPGTPSWTMHQS